jgi:dTDP-glucose pyrophosphorylase
MKSVRHHCTTLYLTLCPTGLRCFGMNEENTQSENKARITITLRQSLLPLLDRFIDGSNIRNRSHAIEFILGQHLGAGVELAVVFAVASSRTGDVDAMKMVGNKPAIAWMMESLRDAGVRHVILVVDEKGTGLREYVGEGLAWNMRITFVKDDERKGTANALNLVKPLIDKTFILMYGDIMAKISLAELIEHHQDEEQIATIALTYNASVGTFGVARMQGNLVVDFAEKPGTDAQHGLVNAGIFVFEPEIFNFVQNTTSIEHDILPMVAKTHQLVGYPFDGTWCDISTNGGLEQANNEWARG